MELKKTTMKILTQDGNKIINVEQLSIGIKRIDKTKEISDLTLVKIVAFDEILSEEMYVLGTYHFAIAKEIMQKIALAIYEEETEIFFMPDMIADISAKIKFDTTLSNILDIIFS